MNAHYKRRWSTLLIGGLFSSLLGACATVDFDASVSQANQEMQSFSQGKLHLAQTEHDRHAQLQAADKLLAQALTRDAAVELALVNSPQLQALLAEHWSSMAAAAQSGRIANPLLSLARTRADAELELERTLSFGLLDLLTLPQRANIAQHRVSQQKLRMSADIIEQVTRVRQAWVNAVAAQQSLIYARQVLASAEASAELAKRMQAVGNFSTLARARQQAFYANAATALAMSEHAALSTRENLVRVLGLDDAQAAQLKLPERLPDLPKAKKSAPEISQIAAASRIDIRLAEAEFSAAASAQGLTVVSSFTDVEVDAKRSTTFDNAAGTRSTSRGAEISIRLPLFDWGDSQRAAMNARSLAALNRLNAAQRTAGSHLRGSYFTYQTSYDIAKHYRDEVVPLHKTIADENLLRYNGMLIGVFELLADSRGQINTVIAAIAAEQQFWLADAALEAAIAGRPSEGMLGLRSAGKDEDSNAPH